MLAHNLKVQTIMDEGKKSKHGCSCDEKSVMQLYIVWLYETERCQHRYLNSLFSFFFGLGSYPTHILKTIPSLHVQNESLHSF